jgi:hypothetical protein
MIFLGAFVVLDPSLESHHMGTKQVAFLAIFYGDVVKLEYANQTLDYQPLTQMPCCAVTFWRQLRKMDPRSLSVLRDARSSARAAFWLSLVIAILRTVREEIDRCMTRCVVVLNSWIAVTEPK